MGIDIDTALLKNLGMATSEVRQQFECNDYLDSTGVTRFHMNHGHLCKVSGLAALARIAPVI